MIQFTVPFERSWRPMVEFLELRLGKFFVGSPIVHFSNPHVWELTHTTTCWKVEIVDEKIATEFILRFA